VLDLLPALRAAIFTGLMGLRHPGLALSSSVSERVIAPGTRIECRPGVTPVAGVVLLGLEYTVEGWFKPVDSEDIAYFYGYTNDAQPRTAWLPVQDGDTIRLPADQPGHYSVQVRAVLGRDHDAVRSADRASVIYLVPDPEAVQYPSVAEEIGH